MAKDMVEPKRKYVDTEATYKKHLLSKAAGPGGLLIITVVQARDLRSLAELPSCFMPCLSHDLISLAHWLTPRR